MTTPAHSAGAFRNRWVWIITGIVAALHLATAARYDFFRNELYFIICGRHPDFGYADQPPLAPLLAAATQVFGENLFLLRLPAVFAAAALIPVTAAIASLLSASSTAAILAAMAAAIAPALGAITATFGTSSFEPLSWTLCAFFLLQALQSANPRGLLWFGLVAGLAFATKYSAAIWVTGLLAGALLTPNRAVLWSRPALIGAAIAILLGAPSLIWQALHGFPFRDIVAYHSEEGKIFTGSALHFIIVQAFAMNILLAPLWLTGLIAPFASARLAQGRVAAIAFIVTAAAIFAAHGKDYYLFPAYPVLFATGAAAIAGRSRWLRAPWFALAAVNAVFVLPLTLPILSPDGLKHYLIKTRLHFAPNERAAIGAPLTQLFSDQMGWRDLAANVTGIYAKLSAQDRKTTGIYAWNYGEASAIRFYTDPGQVPRALSAEDQYFIWGPGNPAPQNLILVNVDQSAWQQACSTLEEQSKFGTKYAMPYENNRPIYLCRGLKNLNAIWPSLKWNR